jgi:hypothetical protein
MVPWLSTCIAAPVAGQISGRTAAGARRPTGCAHRLPRDELKVDGRLAWIAGTAARSSTPPAAIPRKRPSSFVGAICAVIPLASPTTNLPRSSTCGIIDIQHASHQLAAGTRRPPCPTRRCSGRSSRSLRSLAGSPLNARAVRPSEVNSPPNMRLASRIPPRSDSWESCRLAHAFVAAGRRYGLRCNSRKRS